MKRIFLLEYIWSGHNVEYYRTLLSVFLAQECEVVAITPSKQFLQEMQALGTPGLKTYFSDYAPNAKYQASSWAGFAQVVQAAAVIHGKPDLVFFPYLDNLLFPTYHQLGGLKQLGLHLKFPFPWGGLYFHPGYQPYPASDQMLAYHDCKGVGILNPLDLERLNAQVPGAHIFSFPDFANLEVDTSDNPLYTAILEKAQGRKIVVSLGVQARRKGLLTLLDIAQLAPPDDYFFFIGGEVRDQTLQPAEVNRINALAAHAPSNLWLFNQAIPTEAMYNRILSMAQVVFAGYQNFPSSSNTLTKAAALGKPLLGCADHYIGHAIRTYGLGLTYDATDPAAGLAALKAVENFQISTSGQQAFTQLNSHAQLHAVLKRLIETV